MISSRICGAFEISTLFLMILTVSCKKNTHNASNFKNKFLEGYDSTSLMQNVFDQGIKVCIVGRGEKEESSLEPKDDNDLSDIDTDFPFKDGALIAIPEREKWKNWIKKAIFSWIKPLRTMTKQPLANNVEFIDKKTGCTISPKDNLNLVANTFMVQNGGSDVKSNPFYLQKYGVVYFPNSKSYRVFPFVLHEFGHSFGLDDTYHPSAGMIQAGQPESIMSGMQSEELYPDDKIGVKKAFCKYHGKGHIEVCKEVAEQDKKLMNGISTRSLGLEIENFQYEYLDFKVFYWKTEREPGEIFIGDREIEPHWGILGYFNGPVNIEPDFQKKYPNKQIRFEKQNEIIYGVRVTAVNESSTDKIKAGQIIQQMQGHSIKNKADFDRIKKTIYQLPIMIKVCDFSELKSTRNTEPLSCTGVEIKD